MLDQFRVAAGTFPGYHHLGTTSVIGGRNQDSWGWAAGSGYLILSVHDGCSGKEEERLRSEFGSIGGAVIFPQVCAELLDQNAFSWESALALYVNRLQLIATGLVGNNIRKREELIRRYMMFTTVAALITPESTTVASLGDGYFAVNGEFQRIGPFPGNKPPYVGYLLYDSHHPKDQLTFKVRAEIATHELDSLLIGSDGLGELAELADTSLPGKSRLVGAISQLWTDDLLFRSPNPDDETFVPRFRAIQQSASKLRRQGNTITDLDFFPPLIEDDFTAVVVRRKKS